MKSRDDHLKQAKSNEDFAERLLQTGTQDALTWAATLLFYSAAHYGRAFLVANRAKTITGHPAFESYFRRYWKAPPDLFPLYRRLKDDSEAGRYDCISYSAPEIEALRDRFLIPFRDAILATFGP